MLSAEEVSREEETLRDAVAALTDEQRRAYHALIAARTKDPDTYAALNYGLVAGLHHVYLGRWPRALGEIAAFALGVVLLVTGEGWPVGLVLVVGVTGLELYELFRAQTVVRDWNNRVSRRAVAEIASSGPAGGTDRAAQLGHGCSRGAPGASQAPRS